MDHLGDEFFRLLYKKHNQQKQKKMSGITSDLEASAQQKKQINTMEMQSTEWKNVLVKHLTRRELISKAHGERQLMTRK